MGKRGDRDYGGCSENDGSTSESDYSDSRKERKKQKKMKKAKVSSTKREKKAKLSKKKSSKRESSRESKRSYKTNDNFPSSGDDESSFSSVEIHKRRKTVKKKRSKESSKDRRLHKRSREKSSIKQPSDQHRKHNKLSYELADALTELFSKHPAMAEDLPILLIRLCNGATFSLQHSPAQQSLEKVLHLFQPYGVEKDQTTGSFAWHSPIVRQLNQSSQELTLIRVVRTLLDQIGLTTQAVVDYEQERREKTAKDPLVTRKNDECNQASERRASTKVDHDSSKDIPVLVQRIIHSFPGLEDEIVGLCEAILGGESVALNGIDNETLRESLSELLETCHLEECEMQADGDGDEDDNDAKNDRKSPIWGFGLPDGPEYNTASEYIKTVIRSCRNKTPRVLGPTRPPPSYKPDSDEEEGPQLTPRYQPKMSKIDIQDMAKHRQLQLQSVKAGINPNVAAAAQAGGREEWMLVPGQHEFLDSLKTGKPMQNRQFQNLKSGEEQPAAVVDPAIQNETEQLMAAHKELRGPSLMDEHQTTKREQQKRKGNNNDWNWNRDKDLDAGRRVDKDALKMILGGAADGLTTKFQGGFRSG